MNNILIESFPLSVIQDGSQFCIPATIQAILIYHQHKDASSEVFQFCLMREMIKMDENNAPSLKSAEIVLKDDYLVTVKQIEPNTFDEWYKHIEIDINRRNPIAFTTRRNDGSVHIRTIIGINYTSKSFVVFDTAKEAEKLPISSESFMYVIVSGKYEYKFNEAQFDWEKIGGCRDLLQIHLK